MNNDLSFFLAWGYYKRRLGAAWYFDGLLGRPRAVCYNHVSGIHGVESFGASMVFGLATLTVGGFRMGANKRDLGFCHE